MRLRWRSIRTGTRALYIAAGKKGEANGSMFPALPVALFALLFGNPSWARSAHGPNNTASPTTTRDPERHRIADLNSLERGPADITPGPPSRWTPRALPL
jgi:hypothetical protein